MIIFSVEQASLESIDNTSATLEASKRLAKSGTYKVIEGIYKGTSELSFITDQVELGRALAKEYKQECYLERGHYGYWYLIDTASGNVIEEFKTIKKVPKKIAEATDNYSIIDGEYFLASKF